MSKGGFAESLTKKQRDDLIRRLWEHQNKECYISLGTPAQDSLRPLREHRHTSEFREPGIHAQTCSRRHLESLESSVLRSTAQAMGVMARFGEASFSSVASLLDSRGLRIFEAPRSPGATPPLVIRCRRRVFWPSSRMSPT